MTDATDLQLRAFERDDTETVVALWHACGLVVPWNDPHRDIERKLAEQPELFLVGERDGHVVASVMIGYDGHRGWMNYLAVDPAEQGRGHGRALVTRGRTDADGPRMPQAQPAGARDEHRRHRRSTRPSATRPTTP